MNKRKTVRFILGTLTLIVLLTGWNFHFLGWIVPAAMVLGVLGALIFGNRFICGYVCPRGAFLDSYVSKIAKKNAAPSFMHGNVLKAGVLVLLFGFFFFNIYKMQDYSLLPFLFWKMCFITTLIGLGLAFFINERSWCMICPIGSLGGWLKRKDRALAVGEGCVGCGKCNKACPMKINPSSFKGGPIAHSNCISCGQCKLACPKKVIK